MTAFHDTPPALSVVMPSFNQAAFLEEAVRSVFACRADVELVVQDGGSDDGTQRLLARLAAEHPGRLRWWSGPDQGPADAINAAVRRTRAPIVGWLNSDDLYAPGAIDRALDLLQQRTDLAMVYGQGQHVDAQGRFLERYPTLPPSTPYRKFEDGCFICQPTAFFRRADFLALGGLDVGLRAAFDFDLWLRFFARRAGAIGFIDALQASTRMHEAAITTRFRERVALEGVAVVRRHVGPAPAHWLLTHLEELAGQHPFLPEPRSLRDRLLRVLDQARGDLAPEAVDEVLRRLDADVRVRLAPPELAVDVHLDGWAPEALFVRLAPHAATVRAVTLTCRQAIPGGAPLHLAIVPPDGPVETLDVVGNGRFEIELAVPEGRPGARLVWRIEATGGFVPAEVEPGSDDRRRLAYRVEDARIAA